MNVGKLESSKEWIMNPYFSDLNKTSDDVELKEDLIEPFKQSLQMQLRVEIFEEYLCSAIISFQGICKTALTVLIPFAITWLCESGYSNFLSIMKKSRNRLNAQADMNVAISNIVQPRFISMKQKQLSH